MLLFILYLVKYKKMLFQFEETQVAQVTKVWLKVCKRCWFMHQLEHMNILQIEGQCTITETKVERVKCLLIYLGPKKEKGAKGRFQ